jgi:hypothetical protein
MIRRPTRIAKNFDLTWRYLLNFSPTLTYKLNQPRITGEAARVLTELNANGVAISSTNALLGIDSSFDELSQTVEQMEADLADHIAAARTAADQDTIGIKTFIYPLLGQNPSLDPGSIFVQFALQSPILQIANAYFGMYTRLRYYNVWHNFITSGEARESQLWHYDREDYLILKLFLYLSDINENSGPFTYAPGTHKKAKSRGEPESFLENGVRRSTDQQMERFIPSEQWRKCVGPKGTIIFADTRGFHKGGLARERERLMYTCMFTSQASRSHEFLRRSQTFKKPVNKELAFALSTPGIDHRRA